MIVSIFIVLQKFIGFKALFSSFDAANIVFNYIRTKTFGHFFCRLRAIRAALMVLFSEKSASNDPKVWRIGKQTLLLWQKTHI
jgi:hypothetical protein